MTYVSKSASALHLALLKVLRLNVCPTCGREKELKRPFCKTCYFALQKPLQTLLHTSIDAATGEFEDHYRAAMKDLKQRGLVRTTKQWPSVALAVIKATGLIEALKTLAEEEERAHSL